MAMKCYRLRCLNLAIRWLVASPFPDRLPPHRQCTVGVFTIAELARGRRWNRNLNPNSCPGGIEPPTSESSAKHSTIAHPLLPHVMLMCMKALLFIQWTSGLGMLLHDHRYHSTQHYFINVLLLTRDGAFVSLYIDTKACLWQSRSCR